MGVTVSTADGSNTNPDLAIASAQICGPAASVGLGFVDAVDEAKQELEKLYARV